MRRIMKIDFNNCIGAGAPISADELKESAAIVPKAHSCLEAKRAETTWRQLPHTQDDVVEAMETEASRIRQRFSSFVVLGIGGSALGSKALFQALCHLRYNELPKEKRGGPKFYVADNIDPEGLSALLDVIDPKTTCFHVITKSGNTVETMSQFMLAADLLKKELGDGFAENIIVTTDESRGIMNSIVRDCGFKKFVVPDGTGGRFSVLCPVGLLSAAVLGLDIRAMLRGAGDVDKLCSEEKLGDNPAYMFAAIHVAAMKKGINISVLLPYADSLATLAEWYAQLWAESLGKRVSNDGDVVHIGQTPVRALGVTDQHSQIQLYTEGPTDKIITFIGMESFRQGLPIPDPGLDVHEMGFLKNRSFEELIAAERTATEFAIVKAGKPCLSIMLDSMDEYTLGGLFMFFQVATAMAGELLNINTFDQPGVEEGKLATFAFMGRQGYESKLSELSAIKREDASLTYVI